MLLVLLTVVPLMFACSSKKEDDTTKSSGSDESNTPVDTEEKLELPEDVDYDGADFNIITAGNVAYVDFGFTAEDSTVLGQAQYKREQIIAEEYGAVIKSTQKIDTASYGSGAGYQAINKAVATSTVDFHLGIIGGYDVSALASSNSLYDLNSLDYIDTSKSWWDQNANRDLTINGMLFYTNGNLTVAYSESTFVIYVNKAIAEAELGDTDLYQIVRDGKWTIDKLTELSKTVSEDTDGNDIMGPADKFGIYVWDDAILGMMGAVGTKVSTIQEDGTIALTLYNDTSLNMFNEFTEMAYDTQYAIKYQRYSGFDVINRFQNGQALFWATSNINTSKIRSMEADFGILPYPKLSEDQERYYSTIAPYNSQFICVPLILDGQEEYVGTITEALAYWGQKEVWPACYEQTLKGAFARDEGTYDMLDIIYGNYGYDVGFYYMVGKYVDVLLNLNRQNDTAFNSKFEANRAYAEAQLVSINQNYQDVLNSWKKD